MKLKKKKKPRDSTKNSEAAGSNAQHYRSFASNLDRITDTFWKQLGKTMQEDLLEVQQGQVETLIKLEHAFKLALIKHRWGILAYRKFVDYIRDDRQNILDARPFFRERQTTFTAEISPALRDRRARGLFRFRVNWRFVMFVVQSYKWGASSEVRKIAEQIRKVRDELITVNLPLGLNRVKKFWAATQRSHLERMDLVQIACEGLMSAVDKFVPPFTTAFRDVIIGRITGNFIEQYSLHQDTIVETCDGTVKKIKDFVPGDRVYGVDDNGQPLQTTVLALHDHGELEAFEVTFEDGYSVVCSQNHKFLTNRGMVPIKEIVTSGLGVFCEPSAQAWRVECGVRGTILNEKGSFLAQGAMLSVQGNNQERSGCKGCPSTPRTTLANRMGNSLRINTSSKEGQGCALQGVSYLSETRHAIEVREHSSMAQKKSGFRASECGAGQQVFLRVAEEGPTQRESIQRCAAAQCEKMEARKSRTISGKYQKGMVFKKVIEDGVLDAKQSDFNLGGLPNQLPHKIWRGAEAGRLRVSGPQNMGGSGRIFSFFRGLKNQASTEEYSRAGQNVGARGATQEGGYAGQTLDGMFCQSNRQDEGFLDGEIFATSPLSSTGSLVSRRVVRYRSVGTARMYDLEVEHPKHNFLLPNGIVTSNSQTLIHFYPDQRRKLYRAHSFIGKNPDVKTSGNFHDMVHKVNHGVEDKSRLTNESEIANLLAAASVVSLQDTDSSGGNPQGEYNGHSGNGNTRQIEKYAAPEESQPDVRVEEADCLFKLHAAAVTHLSLREKKLLMLKGISLDLLSQEKGGFREKDCQ
jgi:hypothetical protein